MATFLWLWLVLSLSAAAKIRDVLEVSRSAPGDGPLSSSRKAFALHTRTSSRVQQRPV